MRRHCLYSLLLCFITSLHNGIAEPPLPHNRVGPFDQIKDEYLSPPPVPTDLPEGDLFQGDIKVASKFIGEAGTARAPWPRAIIPYVFDCSVENLQKSMTAVREAMAEWESKTCIRFVRKRPEHKAYLEFIKAAGCWATFVGYRKDTKTQISIGHGCDYKHVMVHELGHVIGFWHEQSRKDRDKYIRVNLNNVLAALRYNFNIVKEQTNSFGVPYDFGSIMHYPYTAFASRRGLITIVPIASTGGKTPYVALSADDALQAKKMYKCPGVEAGRAIAAKNLSEAKSQIGSATSGMSMQCVDAAICKELSRAEYCDIYPDPTLVLCPKICRNCGPCIDVEPNCEAWAFYGFCREYPSFMLKKCKYSCAVCKPDPTTAPPTTTRAPDTTRAQPETDRPPTKAPTKKSTTGVQLPDGKYTGVKCVDRSTNCKSWAAQGRCNTDSWVKENCLLGCRRTDICDSKQIKPKGDCANPIGIGWNNIIPDENFYGTSEFRPGGGWRASAYSARLYRTDDHNDKLIGAWCAAPQTKDQYLRINLGKMHSITAVATQGRDVYFEHVSSYYLSSSRDGRLWKEYKENGKRKVFEGNCDNVTPAMNILPTKLTARYIRFHPLKHHGAACLRVEVYGCRY